MNSRVSIIFLLLLVSCGILGAGVVSGEEKIVHIEETTNADGAEFEAKFYSNLRVILTVRNATKSEFDRGFSVRIDGVKVVVKEIDSNDPYEQSWVFDLSSEQNPQSKKQEVSISFVGGSINHTYEQTPTANDADQVQLAQLSDIEFQRNATGEGVELVIAVEDESIHSYAKTITVHTEQTPKAIGRPNDFENGTDTVTIELNEDPGDTVRGEIRLFTGNSDEMNDSLDMVEFEGSVEGETEVNDRDYEPVEERGFYRYGDEESDESNEIEITEEDGTPTETAIAIGILAVGGVVTLLFFLVGTYRRIS